MKQSYKKFYPILTISSLLVAGCSLLGVSDSEPHLVTTLEAFGGPIGNIATAAGKNNSQETTRPQGEGECLTYSQISNIGKESQGLRVSVKGSSIANGNVSNLVATVESEDMLANKLQRTINMHKVDQNTWTGETMLTLKTSQPAGVLGANGSSAQMLTVTIYGDTSSAGSGNLEFEIAPYETSHQPPVKMTEKLIVTAELDTSDHLFSLPSDFPFSVYPGSQFASAGRWGVGSSPDQKNNLNVELATKDSPEQVVQFYKNDTVNKGYHIEKENPEIIEGSGFYGNNGVKEVTLDVEKDKDSGRTTINFKITSYSPSTPADPPSQ